MISTDGATLIATLIPIGLIALAFESRDIRTVKTMRRAYLEVARICFFVAIVANSFGALYFCVTAVAAGEALRGGLSVYVGASSIAVFWLVAVELGLQTIGRYFEALRLSKDD